MKRILVLMPAVLIVLLCFGGAPALAQSRSEVLVIGMEQLSAITSLDPANAGLDALPSVWPVRGFRADVEPNNFAARMGLYSFDAGTPLTAGSWRAARTGAHAAVLAARAVGEGRVRSAFALSRPPGATREATFSSACHIAPVWCRTPQA